MRIKKKLALLLTAAILVTSINVMPHTVFAASNPSGTVDTPATGSTKLSLDLSANKGYAGRAASGSTKLTLVVAEHDWEYSVGTGADANKLTAKCKKTGHSSDDCHTTGVSLTLTATSPNYSGSAYTGASLSDTTAWAGAELEVPTVKYVGRGETAYAESTTAPTKVGTYTAFITADTAIAKVDFEIKKLSQEAVSANSIKITNETISGKKDGKITGLKDTYEYSLDGGKTYVKCTVAELTGLGGCDVYIRKAATDTLAASDAIKVTVKAGDKIKFVAPKDAKGYIITADPAEIDYNGSTVITIKPEEGFKLDEPVKVKIGEKEYTFEKAEDGSYKVEIKEIKDLDGLTITDVKGVTEDDSKPSTPDDKKPGPQGDDKYITEDGQSAVFVGNYVVKDADKKEYTVAIYKLVDKDGKVTYGLMNTKTNKMDSFGAADVSSLDLVKEAIKKAFAKAYGSEISAYVDNNYKTIPTIYDPAWTVNIKFDAKELFINAGVDTSDVMFRIMGSDKTETKAMKKTASVSKKGIVKPKKSGNVTIEAYKIVKVEGKKQAQTVKKINLSVVKPVFDKNAQASYTGQQIDAETFLTSVTVSGNTVSGNTLARDIEAAGYGISWKGPKSTKVAYIDSTNGMITVGEKSGKYKFYMIVTDYATGKKAKFVGKLTVKVPAIKAKKITLKASGTKQVVLKNVSEDVLKTVKWSVEDTTVATVDANGIVTAVASGETNVIATIPNENGTNTVLQCPVKVK